MRLLITLTVLLAGSLAVSNAVAPVPKKKPNPNSTAEKLIGKWLVVRFSNGQPPDPQLQLTFEFRKGGKVVTRQHNRKGELVVRTSTYKVKGNTIHFTNTQNPTYPKSSVTVKEINDKKLVTLDPDSAIGQESRRVEANDRN